MRGYGNRVRAVIIDEPWLDQVSLAIIAGITPHVARIEPDGSVRWEEFDELTQPQPTLRMKPEVWDAIQECVGQHTRSSDATVEALRDTRQVRDRLLTMVEKLQQ